jgi:FAD/FMN-containing dehydrogenase
MYGAISDSLLSAQIVTGTGHILNVSATQYPDLFWGIKGAGFNYSVVTSLMYRIYPATNNGEALIVNALFTGPKNASVWQLASY